MVFAIIYYQYGVRNWQEVERRNQLNDLSNKHYHFSLNKFFDLMASPDLAAVQALVLIACHTRAFPKPGCSAFVCNFAFQRALELNLHRAPRVPESGTNLGIEMRKRTWWVLLSMYVSVTGRRGRPMPITVEEFDVPFPEPINDELISEDGIDTSREMPCEWDVGMATFKIVPILMEMYSNVYSVRRDTQNYSKIIYALEVQLQKWEDELPPGLQRDKSNEHNGLAALYMRMFGLESRLWLRHNSANPTTDKRMMSENTRICEETAREMLQIVQQVISVKALDTTWTQMAVYAMSLFSILVAHWERRFQTTPAKVAELRREMEDWMTVLKEASQLMRSGPQIEVEIRRIVDHTIAWIERDMLSQTRKRSPSPPPAPAVRLKRETASPNTTASQTPPQQSHISAARPSPPVPLQQQQQQPQQPQPQPQPQPQHRRAHTQPHTQPQAQQAQQHIHHASISHAPHRTQSQPLTQVPPQQQPHQHQQQQQQQQITPPQAAARQPASAGPQPVVAHQHEAQPDRSYYSQTNINGHAAYGLGYGEHHRGGQMDPQAYGAETMFYPNSAQQAATAAAAASATGETHPNLLSFAPQTQAVDPTAQFFWRPGGNTWQDWTAAIAQNPSFGNSASLMGLEPAVTTAPEAADHLASLQGGGSTAGDMAAQWPLVMFDQHAQPQNQQHHQSHPSQHYSHGHV